MNYRAIEAIRDHYDGPQELAHLLLIAATYADATTGCFWASVTTLARAARVTQRQARRSLRRLEEDGLIVLADAPVGLVRTYRIVTGPLTPMSPPPDMDVPPSPDMDVLPSPDMDVLPSPDMGVLPPRTPMSSPPDTHVPPYTSSAVTSPRTPMSSPPDMGVLPPRTFEGGTPDMGVLRSKSKVSTKEKQKAYLASSSPKKRKSENLSEPTAEHCVLAQSLGLDATDQWTRYVDYLAATGKPHRDRAAGFRNWLRRAGDFKRGGKPDDGSVPMGGLWGRVI